jgi:uncharacterized spore protein YtfJ
MAENNINMVVDSLIRGMDSLAASKTVVGEAIEVNDTTILPLVDVTFGVGAGAALNETRKNNSGGGGMGAKMTPSALIVVKDGVTRLVNIKNQSSVNKILDMVPEIVERFSGKKNEEPVEPEVQDAMDHAFDEYEEI